MVVSMECIFYRIYVQYYMKVILNMVDEVIEYGIFDIEENDKKFKILYINKIQLQILMVNCSEL